MSAINPPGARPLWMSHEGAAIYEDWTAAVIEACDQPEFWHDFREDIAPDLDGTFKKLMGPGENLMLKQDRLTSVSEQYLLPHQDDILRFTSASQIAQKRRLSKPEAVIAHAYDSLYFSAGLSAGIPSDVYLEHFTTDDAWLNGLSPEQKAAKLRFTIEALGNVSFIQTLQSYRLTGFDVLGEEAAHPIEGSWDSGFGWQHRVDRFNAAYRSRNLLLVTAVVDYNTATGDFAPKPEVEEYLRAAMKRQNNDGLSEYTKTLAGNFGELPTPITRGCPVRAAIGRTAAFTMQACQEVLDTYDKH